jgi:hypothetical protein
MEDYQTSEQTETRYHVFEDRVIEIEFASAPERRISESDLELISG